MPVTEVNLNEKKMEKYKSKQFSSIYELPNGDILGGVCSAAKHNKVNNHCANHWIKSKFKEIERKQNEEIRLRKVLDKRNEKKKAKNRKNRKRNQRKRRNKKLQKQQQQQQKEPNSDDEEEHITEVYGEIYYNDGKIFLRDGWTMKEVN